MMDLRDRFSSNSLFITSFSLYNILFLIYLFTLGYYNRLSGDDYAFVGHLRVYGFFNPFTYWYDAWQGRFFPQFIINTVLIIYKFIPNLLFYTISASALFILSIYKILKLYFPISKLYLLNYSIFLFSTLIFTALEFNTFFWMTASLMYYAGILFALFGVGYILQPKQNWYHLLLIALSFLYVGSSSEHVGILACGTLVLLFGASLVKLKFNIKTIRKDPRVIKILVAIVFCLIAFIIMVLAPGNKVRMDQTSEPPGFIHLIKIAIVACLFILRHVFYKIPYLLPLIPVMLLFGAFLRNKIIVEKYNYYLIVSASILTLLGIIFLSNLPTAYILKSNGPTRSYVFVSFLILIFLSSIFIYTGFRFCKPTRLLKNISSLFIVGLLIILGYVAINEIPQSVKYSESVDARIDYLMSLENIDKDDTIFVEPLYQHSYRTISEMVRIKSNTYKMFCDMSNVPFYILEIGDKYNMDWRNNHLEYGLEIKYNLALSYNLKIDDKEIEEFKNSANDSYESDMLKCYVKDKKILYELDTSLQESPLMIYLRITPLEPSIVHYPNKGAEINLDFKFIDYQLNYTGTIYQNKIFVLKELDKNPYKIINTGFYRLEEFIDFSSKSNIVIHSNKK